MVKKPCFQDNRVRARRAHSWQPGQRPHDTESHPRPREQGDFPRVTEQGRGKPWSNRGSRFSLPSALATSACFRTAQPGFPLSRPQSSHLYYEGLGWVITMLLSSADI